MTTFEQQLEKYAQLAVKVGVNLKANESLLITGTADTLPLVRKITEQAYQIGAKHVEFMLGDEAMAIARYTYGHEYCFDGVMDWKVTAIKNMYDAGYQHMSVVAADPNLLKDIDADLVAKDSKASSVKMHPLMVYRMSGDVKWAIVAMPSPAWASSVFPDLPVDEAIDQLWHNIFKATRIDQEDPVAAWEAHNQFLKDKEHYLNEQKFEKLVYKAEGTDLEVYLGEDHLWEGGSSLATNGDIFMPNLPTEEVFTAPHCLKINGTLKATKPLSYQGKLIDDFGFTIKDGEVVDFYADKGYETLKKLLATDAGARRFGEVALVAYDSPINNTGILFNNTLYDENASCHFALGKAYPMTFVGGQQMSDEALTQKGANESNIHVDFMVGSKDLSIIGYTFEGKSVTLFEKGNWTF